MSAADAAAAADAADALILQSALHCTHWGTFNPRSTRGLHPAGTESRQAGRPCILTRSPNEAGTTTTIEEMEKDPLILSSSLTF